MKCCMGNDEAGEALPHWGDSMRDPLSANRSVASYEVPFAVRQRFLISLTSLELF